MRASDEDRERAATEIREHFAQGRLDAEELSHRLERAYSAQTTGELDALRTDLPALPPDVQREVAARRADLSRQLVQRTGAALSPFFICTLVWVFSDASGSFWPAWTLLIAVIPLVRNGWRLYGPAPDLESVEQELAERRAGGRRR